jgi:hypothetical protein
VTRPGELLPGRRQVLVGAAVTVAAAAVATGLAGCLPGGDDEPEPPDPELLLRARVAGEVRALAAQYAAAVERFPEARAELATLGAEHEAHARALLPRRVERALASATATASPSGSSRAGQTATPSAPPVAPTLRAARADLATAERTASRRRLRQVGRGSPELARLLASVAACEAAHAALLSGNA